jgi:hypothetical protein
MSDRNALIEVLASRVFYEMHPMEVTERVLDSLRSEYAQYSLQELLDEWNDHYSGV